MGRKSLAAYGFRDSLGAPERNRAKANQGNKSQSTQST